MTETIVWIATTGSGERCAFGVESAARAYAGERGRVEAVSMRLAAPDSGTVTEGAINDIAAERRRQIEAEGWTSDHDDAHDDHQLERAAICYAAPQWLREFFEVNDINVNIWPWTRAWWKPKDRRRDLIRAAALIAAAIERIDRGRST